MPESVDGLLDFGSLKSIIVTCSAGLIIGTINADGIGPAKLTAHYATFKSSFENIICCGYKLNTKIRDLKFTHSEKNGRAAVFFFDLFL